MGPTIHASVLLSALLASMLPAQPAVRSAAASASPIHEFVAERLAERVEARFNARPSQASLLDAVRTRAQLLRSAVTVGFQVTGAPEVQPAPWSASLVEHPEWIAFRLDGKRASFSVDPALVAQTLGAGAPASLPRVIDAAAAPDGDRWGHARMKLSAVPRNGYVVEEAMVAATVAEALTDGESSVTVPVQYRAAVIDRGDGRSWSLLSTGRSSFKTSPAGRNFNINKALVEHLDGSLIRAGETFSFNSVLGSNISYAAGWKESLIIVNGKDLVPAPGGGICQAATTFYRAALLAGLPIPTRKSHSLYVTYYEEFGVGLDATVYSGKQDLKVTNDTGDDLLIQAYVVGKEAVVNVFGTPDGRSVALEGPYFPSNAPADLLPGKTLRGTQIGWVQTVRYPDGHEARNVQVSSYNAVPRTLSTKYAQRDVVGEMRSAAPLPL